MSKTIWAIIVIIIVLAGGWFLYTSNPAPQPGATANNAATNATGAVASDNIYLTNNDPAKGAYMTDFAGKTLYTFDNDNATPGQSTCTGTCAANWPAYSSGAASQGNLPANITVITRPDGSSQFAWMGKPLYYYAKDTALGQLLGDGIGGIWHIVKM